MRIREQRERARMGSSTSALPRVTMGNVGSLANEMETLETFPECAFREQPYFPHRDVIH